MGSYQDIGTVYARKTHRFHSPQRGNGIYPLFTNSTLKESYNFENIKNSVEKWDCYSNSVSRNWTKVMDLLEAVSQYGTNDQLNIITGIITNRIVPYIESPAMMKRDVVGRFTESATDGLKSCLYNIKDSLNEAIEADRVLENFDNISKRFDLKKLVRGNILYEDASADTIYALCSLIDTYSMDFKNKFCIAAETAMYTIKDSVDDCDIDDQNLKENLTNKSILENVLDYFLVNYGVSNTDTFLEVMQETAHKDIFIMDQLDDYFALLNKVYGNWYNEDTILKEMGYKCDDKKIKQEFVDESVLGLAEDLRQYDVMREELENLVAVQEMDFASLKKKASEGLAKIKMLPSQAAGILKGITAALLVPCRAEDIGKATHNILADLFYATITIGALAIGGPLVGVINAISTYIIRKAVQKQYFKLAIQEWREHKYSVQRKLNDCEDPEKKRRLEAYLAQITSSLNGMEKKYEEMRDKTLDQIKTASDKRMMLSGGYKNADVNPSGKITPASALYNPNGSNSHLDIAAAAMNRLKNKGVISSNYGEEDD